MTVIMLNRRVVKKSKHPTRVSRVSKTFTGQSDGASLMGVKIKRKLGLPTFLC
jgi:hypothetical protein